MTDSFTRTLDGSILTLPEGALDRGPRLIPRLRVLYHVDLARVGALSHPDAAFEDGEWLTIGRGAVSFATTAAHDVWRPLTDPAISRSQLKIRWIRDAACFEVEPSSSAKRSVHAIRLDTGGSEEITDVTRVEAGACLAIGDRVLLALEAMSAARSIDEDRMGLVGESDEMWRLRRDIHEVGAFHKPALVLGQTGSGKELVAKAIHEQGRNARGPFKAVNCAALPEQLVESMLFGHTRGAFTGADANREGLFRAAHGGTLFLDELGEMPIAVQPKLLRTLQDGMVTAVGQHQSAPVDVRLVAATNRDPIAEIEAGRLRADLYHRLAAHVVHVPPLSARRLDVPELFLHFLERSRREHPELAWLFGDEQQWRPKIPLAFFVELMRAPWSGNVREVENAAEQTARRNLREGPFQRPSIAGSSSAEAPPPPSAALPTAAPRSSPSRATPSPHAPHVGEASQLLGIARKTVAKLLDEEVLVALLQQAHEDGVDDAGKAARLRERAAESLHARFVEHDFSQARVAKVLGVSAWTLIRLMQDLGLRRPADLSTEEIRRALDGAGGDVAEAATRLKVSEHGLKKRLIEVGIGRG